MNFSPLLLDGARTPADATGRIYGLAVGLVTANKDDDGMDRIQISLPWLAGDAEKIWARQAVLMAGKDRGTSYLPEVGDEVLVAFEHGDIRYPYILGALWNGKDARPEKNSDGKNDKRLIKSRSGMTLLFDDKSGSEEITIADKDGNNKVVIQMAKKKIIISSNGDIDIMAEKGTLTIKAKTIEMSSMSDTKIEATGTLNLKGMTANLKGNPMVNIN